ncbi:NmrA/HSCARG family protein [Haloarchaeobius sp. HME9146]|uniref:NmrA/HSCARG family protein n=1 Tax=Haloarchaeobius sp. HME9146 TaxID=2978732 RepID=UPI0021C176A6|nr:NmrA/HSCARG family protein [Haloarchaeobius sp. HME9146]MCT9096274.1 NmrA/HSCARG family protein [Haloarchaeobius sp. HME9146]
MLKILVSGATGTQGGAVIDHLSSGAYGDFDLYGLTRDATSERAQGLATRGVTVVEGDMCDADRMTDLCTGMDGVFCVTTFFEDGTDIETEQGTTLATCAADAGVSHFVYSSVGGADRETGLAHFDSKYAVEQALADLDLTTTIVRPVFFMQNLTANLHDEITEGRLPLPLDKGVALQLVDATDIGRAAAMAFADPDTFAGETIELAGDECTLTAMASEFADYLGIEVDPVYLPIDDYRAQAGDELADMFQWFNDVGYDSDIDELSRRYGIHCNSLSTYLEKSEAWQPAPAATR